MNWLLAFTLISSTLASTGTERSVELMPDEAVGIEHGNITLTCSSKVDDIGVTTWTCPDVPSGINVFVEGDKCNPGAPFDNATKYLWNCHESKRIGVTIRDISRRQHGDKWICQVNFATYSNEATLYVKVPVEQVAIRVQDTTSQNNDVINLNEHEDVTVICNTSDSRPNSSITLFVSKQDFNVMEIISQAEPQYANGRYDLWQTIETFSFRPNRTSNAGQMYCNASNGLGTWVTSTKIKLNIKYPPNHPPRIDNLPNESYSLIEGSVGNLTCSTEEANPMANLTWICNEKDFNFSQSMLNGTSKILRWISNRNKSTRCTCQSMHELAGVRTATVSLISLYPAGDIAVSLSMGVLHVLNITNNIKLIENVSLVLTMNCSASGNPLPNVHMNSNESILKLAVIRNISGNYTCIANNTMIPDAGQIKITSEKSVYTIDILYPPNILTNMSNAKLLEKDDITIKCSIKDGRTTNHSVIWLNSDNKGELADILQFTRITRRQTGIYTCELHYTMIPTFGNNTSGTKIETVSVDVLYPPENISSSLQMDNVLKTNILEDISVIENISSSVDLYCSALSNPAPAYIFWEIDGKIHNKSIIQINADRNAKGIYTCHAINIMQLSNGSEIKGGKGQNYSVDILYPPYIYANWTKAVIAEGHNINISCTDSPGRTSQQSIQWMKSQGHITFNNSLTIKNVTRQHSGNYTCFVNYTMIPTYGESKTEVMARGIYIDVQYKPEISNFFAGEMEHNIGVTVNEDDNIRMVCNVDSNPKSTIQISVANNQISSKENTTTLEHFIYRSRCTDMGNYICSAYNVLNTNGPFSSKTLQLFVNCSPRRSPNIEIQQTITTSQQGSATFSFVVIAFPRPHFKWFKIANSTILEANKGFTTLQILSENEMQIYFTITNIAMTDFGEYVLTINNTFGGYQQSYFLIKKDQINAGMHTPEVMSVGIIAGVAAGSVIATLLIVAAVYIIHKRLHRKELNKTRELTEINQYQNLSEEGIDISTANDSRSPNVYESLQDIGSERQYLELSALESKNTTGTNNVYLNSLQSHCEMTSQAGDLQEAETCGIKGVGKQST